MTVQQAQGISADYDPQRPYRDYPAVELVEWLEAQHRRGEYSAAVVFELAARALELEALRRPGDA